MGSYRIQAGLTECEGALDELKGVIAEVWQLGSSPRDHGEIEKHLDRRMHDVARLILQAHFDRLAREEERREDVVDAEGNVLRYARERSRALVTVHGEVQVDFEGFYQQRECRAEPRSKGEKKHDIEKFVAMTMDGKGIVMRHEDLREQTQKRAEEENHKLSKRLSRGEKRNRKRMAQVASVYEVAPHYRSAEDIIVAAQTAAQRAPAPKPSNKRVWASVKRSTAEVADEVFMEARRRDPEGERTWVMLVDGQEEQLRQVEAAVERHKAKVVVIQDFYHVTEYVWGAAWCLFEEGDPAAQKWVDEHLIEILNGKSSSVAAGMRRSATWRGLSEDKRAALDKCADYLLKNGERLRYDEALRRGMPIGTGVIEGACRHLVKRRMECSGARWSLDGAEAVLQLRALHMSGDWDEYWAYHCRQERQRNYPEWCDQQQLTA